MTLNLNPACPLAQALERNRMSIARELRLLKRNLKICEGCQARNGACGRMQSLRDEIREEIRRAMEGMGEKDG